MQIPESSFALPTTRNRKQNSFRTNKKEARLFNALSAPQKLVLKMKMKDWRKEQSKFKMSVSPVEDSRLPASKDKKETSNKRAHKLRVSHTVHVA